MHLRSLFSLIIILIICNTSFSQIRSTKALKDSVLFKSRIKGFVLDIRTWKDNLGTNHLVLTEDSARHIAKDELNTAEKNLYAYHFLNKDSLLWKVTDHERECEFDITAEFREKATTITDLDKNGIAETWVMYSLACRSDVSCSTLKLIMHQGSSKHIIRGTSQFSKEYTEYEYGGKYVLDVSFAGLSKIFKDFAKELWKKNLYDEEAMRN